MINTVKLKPKMKTSKSIFIQRLSIIAITVVGAVGFMVAPLVAWADQFDDQINAIKQQNAQTQASKDQLGAEASSLQDEIGRLQVQIDTLQAQIQANQAKRDDLTNQIALAEQQLEQQKAVLGVNIKTMYLEGQISTIEMLASSKDLSQFLDKQQYRTSVQDKIKTTLDRINALKKQLKDQKVQVEKLLADQQAMQGQLASQQAQQSQILALNQEQQASLDSQIKDNNSRISQLRAQQAAENAKHFRGYTIVPGHNGNDTYPDAWRLAYQDSLIDSWGMYNRECVSYTAWKVASTGRYMPYWGGAGNANQWPADARAAGIPVGSSPQAGDVAIAYWGSFGHAMYVDSVNSDGTINISQYNWDYHGTYSEIYHFSPSGLSFIHFQ